ncbi:MAG: hypothetical protein FJ312_06320 [SAR202 cluster bacterium]|nr:hypothetical protein [SAR202 cluster bacterium]
MAQKARNEAKWWGEEGRAQKRLSLLDLVKNHTLDVETAALLWLLIEKKSSVIVASQAPQAGKTTLLTALSDFIPPKYQPVYVYGGSSDAVPPADAKPNSTYLLASELGTGSVSGKSLVGLFKALTKGYSLGATLRADSPEEVFRALSTGRTPVPAEQIARLHAIVNLRLVQGTRSINRRVSQLTLTVPRDGSGWRMVTLAGWEPDDDSHIHMNSPETRETLASRLKMDAGDLDEELATRARRLQAWLDIRLTNAEQLRQAVLKYYDLRDHPPAKPVPAAAPAPAAKSAPPAAKPKPQAKAAPPAAKLKAKPVATKAVAAPSKTKKAQPVKAKAKPPTTKPKPKAKAPPPKPKLRPKARTPLPKTRTGARPVAASRAKAKAASSRKAPPTRSKAKAPSPRPRPKARPAAPGPRPTARPAAQRARAQARPRSR